MTGRTPFPYRARLRREVKLSRKDEHCWVSASNEIQPHFDRQLFMHACSPNACESYDIVADI